MAEHAPEAARGSVYRSEGFARAFEGVAEPAQLARAGGWLLERSIGGGAGRDAVGPYPIFDCENWDALADELAECGGRWVSVACVPDPFGSWDLELLRRAFPDVVRPFKQHYVIDLEKDPGAFVARPHRYRSRRALRTVRVEIEERPLSRLDEWCGLYEELRQRHAIEGLAAFSRESFARQLALEGVVLMRALHEDEFLGAHLWFLGDGIARSHLTAVNERGYELGASYALHWEAIRLLRGRVRWLNLGGGAGSSVSDDDGLARFKRGFASEERTAYFCGRVSQPDAYARLVAAAGTQGSPFFPAYRAAGAAPGRS